ncbi:MAG: choice-of-anchor D domain-containing protein [Candidatus Acidiferrales bacterium]
METNEGQAESRVSFIARGSGSTVLLTQTGIDVIIAAQGKMIASRTIEISFESQNAKPRSRRKSRKSNASGAHRDRRARKRSGRPRNRRSRAAGDQAPVQKQVPHQNAPRIPTAPRENDPPSNDALNLRWQGIQKLAGETNYFIGNDRTKWRTHVPHFSRALAKEVLPGMDVVAYGNRSLEYDMRLAPQMDPRKLRLHISGADSIRLDANGNLVIVTSGREIQMQKPSMYEELTEKRRSVEGGYALEPDGRVAFRIEEQEPAARLGTLVIDPTLSVLYSTFLGGSGDDVATGTAVDSSGKIYVSGTTSSATSFPESSTKLGPGGGNSDYFIAKIDPSKSGLNSLLYLTFIGGSGDEAGGSLAVNSSGDAAIAGTTTSNDYPVTDGSTRTSGSNDATITEISASGAQLLFSTLFGGSGAQATQGPGGIAMDSSGNIFVAMDTSSADLTTTASAFQTVYGGGISDGFLAIFQPTITPSLKYCTYLGIDAQATVASIAVDTSGNAFLAGFTTNPGTSLNTSNGFQTTYGGDPSDAFVMKLTPAGNGAADLSYGTFLGGVGADKALAITVGTNLPATAYVTGSTQSSNFPINGSVAPFQTTLKGTANAFLSVIVQDATTGATALAYSSYLGGSVSDSGQGIWFAAVDQIYVAGTTTSFDFPRQNNFQPYNGDSDAFVSKLDPTSPAAASLLYSTPLGGTAPLGVTAGSQGNAIAADTSGNIYIAGATTTGDFPRTANPGNGLQLLCASCQLSPPQNDAFVVEIASSASASPSVSFNAANLNFGPQPVGMPNNAQLPVAIINTGDYALSISFVGITGPNSVDFSASDTSTCLASPISSGGFCSFEMQFAPSIVGDEGAALSISSNAPGSPQVLALFGTGSGPLAVPSPLNVNFGNVPSGTTSPSQEITLTNTGNQPLQITEFNFSGDVAQFSLGQNSCTAGNMVSAGGSCTIQVSFVPSTTGTFNASLNITDNSGNIAGAVQSIPLTGVGTPPAPILIISPTALGFAAQSVGTTSASQTVTVFNNGSAALDISSLAITGTGAGNFGIIQAGSAPCAAAGNVAAGASCTVTINFTPTSLGTKNAALSLGDNASGSPQMVSLTGTGVSPAISVSATNINFGSQPAGTASTARPVTVSNVGNVPLGIAGISMTGLNSADFIETNNCPPSLGVNNSCHISVQFDPAASGPSSRMASLSIADNVAGSPQVVSLAGTVVVAAVSLSTSTVNFGSQVAGVASSAVAVTLTNTGTGALTVSGASLTDTADFGTPKNDCTGIPSGGTCKIQVSFNPAAPGSGAQCGSTTGAKTANLILTDNTTDSPQTVVLNGNATDFCTAPATVGGNTVTVSAGTAAVYQLEITSVGGFSGSVALACSGAIPGGTCTTSAASVSVAANGQTPFQVNVTTAAGATPRQRQEPDWLSWQWYPVFIAALILFVLAKFDHRARENLQLRPANRRFQSFADLFSARTIHISQASLLVTIFAFAMSACGGGNGATGTQATTYSLTVTASAGGANRTATLTLIVQ